MGETWYYVKNIPDLTLNQYASLEDSGVDGVLEKHIAFLRQLNRKGILSDLSFHLFYLYLSPDNKSLDLPGQRLQLFFMIKSKDDSVENIPALVEASPLSEFYHFSSYFTESEGEEQKASIENYLKSRHLDLPPFTYCSILSKNETLLPSGSTEIENYYLLREWEMNKDGRLYNMFTMMEAVNKTAIYRVDLYPVERSESLRKNLRTPMNFLRRKQEDRFTSGRRDYEGKDVLESYESLVEKFDSSPHFISNIMVFANSKSDSTIILDAAGAESLIKGKYNVSTFAGEFNYLSFLNDDFGKLENIREKMVVKQTKKGLIVCREDTVSLSLNYLPTMFSLEEITPFFRLPALYDGEVIQLPKETAPLSVSKKNALFLGKDKNGYDINFPLDLLPKHAFISGVPGSGKTNTMHHITSSLWKDHRIPFLVLEPAKQEYRALANDHGMEEMYIFSPNADMSFPLHINPFEMPKGIMVAEHIRRLCSVFEGAFPLEPPMPFLLDTAIEAVYRELGWIPEHIYTGEEKQRDGKTKRNLPTMSMLYRKLEEELKTTSYSDEVRGNLESALQVRIGSLLRREMGDVFDVPSSTFTPEKWLEVPAVIELESMGSGPANFLTLMLCALIRETLKVDPNRDGVTCKSRCENETIIINCFGKEFLLSRQELLSLLFDNNGKKNECFICSLDNLYVLTLYKSGNYIIESKERGIIEKGFYVYSELDNILSLTKGNKDIRHVIFIEEAHNLIGPESEEQPGADADPKQAATAFVVKMLAEVRALKEGIVIADQLPTVMAQEVLKNTGLKIALRITSADDRNLLGSTMAASPMQLEQMATYKKGQALIFYENLKRPFEMQIHRWRDDIKDNAKRDLIVNPKNDSDLRSAIKEYSTYIDENERSIEIIGTKYYQLSNEKQKMIIRSLRWYEVLSKTARKLHDFDAYFMNVERGKISISPEKKAEKYDQYLEVTQYLLTLLSRKEMIEKPFVLMKDYMRWVFSLERLVNGRWTRFHAKEKDIAKISALEFNMIDKCLKLYHAVKSCSESSKEAKKVLASRIQEIEDDISDIITINEKAECRYSVFFEKYGEKALKN